MSSAWQSRAAISRGGIVGVDNGMFWRISTTLEAFTTDIEFDFDPEVFVDPDAIVVIKRENSEDPWEIVASELVPGESRIRVLGQETFSEWDLAQIPEPWPTALWIGVVVIGMSLVVRRRVRS